MIYNYVKQVLSSVLFIISVVFTMVTCAAINCAHSSSKQKKDEIKGWHNVPRTDKLLRKKWFVSMKRDPPYTCFY